MYQESLGLMYKEISSYATNWLQAEERKIELARSKKLIDAFEVSREQRRIERSVQRDFGPQGLERFKEQVAWEN